MLSDLIQVTLVVTILLMVTRHCEGLQGAYCKQNSTLLLANQSEFAPYLQVKKKPEVVMRKTDSSCRLYCCMHGNPTPVIKWRKNGINLDPRHIGPFHIFYENRQVLSINPVRKNDTGNYTCHGSNDLGNVSHFIRLEVKDNTWVYRPDVKKEMKVWNATLYTNLTIQCYIISNSKIKHTFWGFKRNGTYTRAKWKKSLVAIDNEQSVLQLHIVNVTKEDQGTYICSAFNDAGLGKDSGVLYVMQRPAEQARDYLEDNSHAKKLSSIIIALVVVVSVVVVLAFVAWRCYRNRRSSIEYPIINDKCTENEHHPFMGQQDIELHAEDLRERMELLASANGNHHEFDVFISYSSLDRDLVKNVFYPEISSTHKVCIDYKDFEAGRFIQDNIADAIFRSRKTILMITKNFLGREGGWTYFEMQIAQGRLQQGHDVLVPVIVEEIPFEELPVILQHYRLRRTYLEWFNEDVKPHFWDRLRNALGPSVQEENA